MSDITFSIPVKPHVKRFLDYKFQEQYRLNQNDAIGIFIFCLLRKPVTHHNKVLHDSYSETFDVKAKDFYFFHCGCKKENIMSIFFAIKFNTFVDKLIKDSVCDYIDTSTSLKMSIRQSIFSFLNKYEFDESSEMNLACLQKHYYRYQLSRETKKTV